MSAIAAFVPLVVPMHALDLPGPPRWFEAAGPREQPSRRPAPAKARLAPYRGLGAWVDIYDRGPWKRPRTTVGRMHRRGVRTVYLQTGNWGLDRAVFRPRSISAVLEAAHRRNMDVVAWYVPSFASPAADLRRSLAAIRFRSPRGHEFDSFALDIEATVVRDLALRNRRLRQLGRALRKEAGRAYGLGAIVPDVGSSYWPNFPYPAVDKSFDVFLPMAYYTFRTTGYRGVAAYTAANMRRIRRRTGDRNVPIHPIGGLAGEAGAREVRAFVSAARRGGAIGAGLYDYSITTSADWRELRAVPGRRGDDVGRAGRGGARPTGAGGRGRDRNDRSGAATRAAPATTRGRAGRSAGRGLMRDAPPMP